MSLLPRAGASARGASPLDAALRALQTLDGALAVTAPAAEALAGPASGALRADPARLARAEAFLHARRQAGQARARAQALWRTMEGLTGPLARNRAAAGFDLRGLQAHAAAVIAAARALKADPWLGPLLPAALGQGVPRAPAPARPLPAPEAGSLAGLVAAIAPLYRYTAARMPYVEAGLACHAGQPGPAGPEPLPLIARALGALYAAQPPALVDSRQALAQTAALRRGMLAARGGEPPTAAQLRGLALPLAYFPRRFTPYPVLQALFPPVN